MRTRSRSGRLNFAPGFGLLMGALLAFGSLGVSRAQAAPIPYFNGLDSWGFDNSSLGLAVGYEIPLDATFLTVAGPGSGADLIVEATETINDPQGGIDREIVATITAIEPPDDVFIFFSALDSESESYQGALIILDPLVPGEFAIATFGPYLFAGYVLPAEDLAGGGAVLEFRYTVNIPQGWGGPPGLGVAATDDFTIIPEPSVGLLVGLGLVALSARRRA